MKEIITFFNFSIAYCQTHSGYLTWWLNIKETIKAQNINSLTYNIKLVVGLKIGYQINIEYQNKSDRNSELSICNYYFIHILT